MNNLKPPKSYVDYCCYVQGLSGQELINAQEKFYKKNSEHKTEICQFFNSLKTQRENMTLPIEKIEIFESDGKKHGMVMTMMIYDIEYWIEGGEIKKRKIYVPLENQYIQTKLDFKQRAAGEREPGEEG